MFPLEVILTGGFCRRKWGVGWLFHYKNPFFAYVCWEWKWTLHPLGTNHGISSNEGQNRLIKEDSVKNGEYRSKIARSCDCLVFWCILNFWPGDQPLKLSISSRARKLVAFLVSRGLAPLSAAGCFVSFLCPCRQQNSHPLYWGQHANRPEQW